MDTRFSSVAGTAALRAGARLSVGVRVARPSELRAVPDTVLAPVHTHHDQDDPR